MHKSIDVSMCTSYTYVCRNPYIHVCVCLQTCMSRYVYIFKYVCRETSMTMYLCAQEYMNVCMYVCQ